MSNDNIFFGRGLVDQAQRERLSLLAEFGNKLVHAPSRIIRMGIDDFKRYRRPANS
ncbi:MAG: hypothetical protein QGH73_06205 [Rhodospirillales bacterium]|jgi:hypothetical protein|nr:hypothetical protein [Rhodospirillales bacterium]MDP6642825.1 hypothetical protein [Rhodospirillales bacterium]MDP6841252.1 hypothetical protein [Rhodospirillales bacterium]|tara:strand:- start:1035 stop:1202 length:168 start_codon:yes stop_codon:yes gene_type:complete